MFAFLLKPLVRLVKRCAQLIGRMTRVASTGVKHVGFTYWRCMPLGQVWF
jgi:hypothetical protein